MNTLYGFEIVEAPHMVLLKSREVQRTWMERLFTLPWKPLEAMKTKHYEIPNPDVIRWEGKLIMHPEVKKKLIAELETQSSMVVDDSGAYDPNGRRKPCH